MRAVYETAKPATAFGRSLISREQGGGDMNVTPSISPDGSRVVFLSEKSLFSIDMYVADVATGRITRKLVETTSDPHFDSLQFIASAGDWAADNRRFVFAALHAGQPVLTIVDTSNGRSGGEYEFKDLGEIYNPAFSPDGKQIAFSALKGGVLDLFVYTPENGALQQLTSDPFADLDPEWSPDGREIVWVTDRFSSDLDTLSFGNYRIGAMNVSSRQARALAGFESGRNSNPEFGADGSLYFLATPDGIPNVYRLSNAMGGGTATRVTNVVSGVSGITPLTPAMSAASAANALVFTVFENDHYNIYAADTSRPASVGAPASDTANAAVLPPANRRSGTVQSLLQSSTTGLPQPRDYEVTDYRPKLQLEGISQPTIGVGVNRFGAYAGGGISFLFSDFLERSHAWRDGAVDQPHRGHRRTGDLPQSQVAMELGPGRRAFAVCNRQLRPGALGRQRPAGHRPGAGARHAAQLGRERGCAVSIQPSAARGVFRRRAADWLRVGSGNAVLLALHRRAARRAARGSAASGRDQPG